MQNLLLYVWIHKQVRWRL